MFECVEFERFDLSKKGFNLSRAALVQAILETPFLDVLRMLQLPKPLEVIEIHTP